MDSFFATVPLRRKMRVHFHAFMRDVHEELQTLKNEVDPLAAVARRIAKRWRLVCFDEFHVSDIADAMILGRLLDGLFAAGVVFVMTSNYPPDGLYPGRPPARELPADDRAAARMAGRAGGGWRHRLSAAHAGAGRRPSRCRTGREPRPRWRRRSRRCAAVRTRIAALMIEGRALAARRRAGSAVWFDFAALCDGPRSQRDYLEIAQPLRGRVPVGHSRDGRARWRPRAPVHLAHRHPVRPSREAGRLGGGARGGAVSRAGRNAREFPRTVSRLAEMRTRETTWRCRTRCRTARRVPITV